tara:strand:- start:561 stop:1049 length:489 start_codon:yes stop_codon:yes gene_type:complete
MATNNLLQRLPMKDDITFADVAESNRRQVETFLSGALNAGVIDKGDIVAFDTSKTGPERVIYVNVAPLQANGNGLACGVAITATTGSEQRVDVIVAGYAANVNCHGALVAANRITAAGTSAGTADGRIAADIAPAFAVALEASRATADGYTNPTACWIYKQF